MKTVTFYYCFKLPNTNRFLEFALLHTDALTPSRTFYLQDLSGSYDVTSAINRGSARPLCCVSDQSSQYLHSTRTCYCGVIISSPSTNSLKCCEKALKDNRHITSVAKQLFFARGSPQVRGLRPRPACFNVFHASDRTQYSPAAETPREPPEFSLFPAGKAPPHALIH